MNINKYFEFLQIQKAVINDKNIEINSLIYCRYIQIINNRI